MERTLRVPLELRNVPDRLEIVGDPPMTVDVRLRGSSALLGRMDPGDVIAILDLAAARPGSRLFHLRTDEVRRPYGVEVAQITPATISLELEPSATALGTGGAGGRGRSGAGIRHRTCDGDAEQRRSRQARRAVCVI